MIKISRNEYLLELRNTFDRLHRLSSKKGLGYCGDDEAYKNFNFLEHVTHGKISSEVSILARICDKIGRIGTLYASGQYQQLASEAGDLDDLTVYVQLLRIACKEIARNGNATTTTDTTS